MSGFTAGDLISGLGTLLVAITAIWGKPLRGFFVRPDLAIVPHNLRGEPTHDTKDYYVYYHLKVVNKRRWLPVRHCKVSLVGYSKKVSTGEFRRPPMAVPFQFVWSPADKYRLTTITNDKVFDFIRLNTSTRIIEPVLYETPYSFLGRLSQGEVIRYEIQFTCDNAYGYRSKVYEISLERGEWDIDPWKARQYVSITEVPALVEPGTTVPEEYRDYW